MATYQLVDAPPYDSIDGILKVSVRERNLPPRGDGYLAGTFPDGITRIDGVPGSATVRVLYRASSDGDGVLVAQVESGVDGTWLVEGLDPALKYDVVCRKDGFNDMILSNVSPATD